MTWLDKLEKKWGRYAIQNITKILIGCYVAGFLIQLLAPALLGYLTLEPALILRGQVWRLFTWLLILPGSYSGTAFFLFLIMLYFYYSVGNILERSWGTFRFNVYLISGILFTVAGGFLLYGIFFLITGNPNLGFGSSFSTYYVNMSIFLAYAATFPELKVLFMMFIPVKVKVLGMIYGAYLLFEFIQGDMVLKVVIVTSLLNFIIFFLSTRNLKRYSPKQIKRRQAFKKQVQQAEGITRHKCAVCGQTEKGAGNLEFRFCSKCDGNYEYCQNHLFTHTHVRQ